MARTGAQAATEETECLTGPRHGAAPILKDHITAGKVAQSIVAKLIALAASAESRRGILRRVGLPAGMSFAKAVAPLRKAASR